MKAKREVFASLRVIVLAALTDVIGLIVIAGIWRDWFAKMVGWSVVVSGWLALPIMGIAAAATVFAMGDVFEGQRVKINLFNAAWDAFRQIGTLSVPSNLAHSVWGWSILPVLRDKDWVWLYAPMGRILRLVIWTGTLVCFAAVAVKLATASPREPNVLDCLGVIPSLALLGALLNQPPLPQVLLRSNEELAQAVLEFCIRLMDPRMAAKNILHSKVDGFVDTAATLGDCAAGKVQEKITDWLQCPAPQAQTPAE